MSNFTPEQAKFLFRKFNEWFGNNFGGFEIFYRNALEQAEAPLLVP